MTSVADDVRAGAPTRPDGVAAGKRGAARLVSVDRTLPVVVILAILLAIMVLPPLWYLVQGSFYTTDLIGGLGDFTFEHYRELLTDTFVRDFINSIIFAAGSSILAIVLGGVMAWLVERTNVPFKPIAYVSALISLGTPYLIYVIAWLYLAGKNGPINAAIRWLTGMEGVPFNIYSMAGMILIEGFLWSPMIFLLLGPIFRMSNADFEEAARMAGAGLPKTIWRISVKLATPAFLSVALLTFIRSLEAFEVPILTGWPGGVNILTTEIWLDMQQRVPPNLGRASAFAVVLLALTAVLIYFYMRVTRHAERFQTVTGKGFRPRIIDLGRGRGWAGLILIANVFVVLILPAFGLLWLSLMPFYQNVSLAGLEMANLKNYTNVLNSTDYLELIWITFIISAGGATLVMAVTTLSSWFTIRRRAGAWVLEQLSMVPLAFPGIVLGVALLQQFLSMPIHIYGTAFAFIFAYGVRFLPYGARYASSGVIQIHRELEDAAGVAGAPLKAVFLRIVVPLAWPAILSGWLFVFLICARDLSMSIMIASPSLRPVAVKMFALWSEGQGPVLAAFGLMWTLIMTLVATVLYVIGRRTASAKYGL